MDYYIVLFICFQLLLYFIQKSKKNDDKGCLACKENCYDQVETICGHFICCKI